LEYIKHHIEARVSRLFIVGLGVIFLIACASNTDRTDKADESPTGVTNSSTHTGSPNPYLLEAPDISAPVQAKFQLGIAAMNEENWDEAKKIFLALTSSEKELSGPWVNLGIIHKHAGNTKQAESDFRQAIDINSLNFDAYNHLAILKREQSMFLEAEKIFQNSIAKWSDNSEAHCNLGILYDLYIGDFKKALYHYKKCEDLNNQPNKQLRGWIVDLERRIKALNR